METRAPSAYEQQRLARIRRNREYMARLGLGSGSRDDAGAGRQRGAKRRAAATAAVRSGQRTAETTGAMDAAWVEGGNGSRFVIATAAAAGDDDDDETVVSAREDAPCAPAPSLRRSHRIRALGRKSYAEDTRIERGDVLDERPNGAAHSWRGHAHRRRITSNSDDDDDEDAWTAPSPRVESAATSGIADACSTRTLRCRVDLLHRFLGRAVPVPRRLGGQIKYAVMWHAAGGLGEQSRHALKFNRMSGICEWRDAVMLFVNLPADTGALHDDHHHDRDDDGGDDDDGVPTRYRNVFRAGGRIVTWFAQRAQTAQHRVIRRLIDSGAVPCSRSARIYRDDERRAPNLDAGPTAARPAATAFACSAPPPAHVLLFCRLPKPHCANYLYFGRLAYRAHAPSTRARPMRFEFRLLDFDALAVNGSSSSEYHRVEAEVRRRRRDDARRGAVACAPHRQPACPSAESACAFAAAIRGRYEEAARAAVASLAPRSA